MADTQTQAATETKAEPQQALSVDDRANALMEQVRAGNFDEDAAPAEAGDEPAPPKDAKAKPAPDADEEADTKAEPEDRGKTLDRIFKLEREHKAKDARLAQREASIEAKEQAWTAREKAIEEREAAAKAAEAAAKERERAFDDPSLWMHHLIEKVPFEVALEHFKKAQDPSYAAELAARRVLAQQKRDEPKEADDGTKAKLAALEAKLAEKERAEARASAEADVVRAAKDAAAEFPDVHRLAEKRRDEFLHRVHNAADELRKRGEVVEYQNVLQEVQSTILEERKRYEELFGGSSTESDEPSSTAAKSPTQSAQVSKARTLTARTSAGRSSIVEDDDFATLSLDDRAAKLKEVARSR